MKKRYLFFVSHLYALSIVRPLQEEIKRRGDESAWFLKEKSYSKYLSEDETELKSIKEVTDYNPCAVFVASNIVPDFFPGIKVQLFHGFNAQKRNENKGHFRIRGFFDLYCTQGPSTTKPFKELEEKHRHFEVVETGWCKMDPLFNGNTNLENYQRPVVLFTSTFTPALSAAHKIFDKIKSLSENNKWQWLVTFHPKMDEEIVKKYKSIQNDNLKFIETDNIIPLLKTADIMLSDTSSVITEFILQQKPVVTFKNRVPGPHLLNIKDPEQIESAIEKGLNPTEELAIAIKEYTEKVHPYSDGLSSARVLDATDSLVKKGLGHLKRKPLNLIRKIKIRRNWGYFGF